MDFQFGDRGSKLEFTLDVLFHMSQVSVHIIKIVLHSLLVLLDATEKGNYIVYVLMLFFQNVLGRVFNSQ